MASTKFNFNIPLRGADEELLKDNGKDIMLSTTLSNVIMNSTTTEAVMKFFDWGLELRKSGELTLDQTDKETLSKFILSSQHIPNLTKGRLNEVLIKK